MKSGDAKFDLNIDGRVIMKIGFVFGGSDLCWRAAFDAGDDTPLLVEEPFVESGDIEDGRVI